MKLWVLQLGIPLGLCFLPGYSAKSSIHQPPDKSTHV